MRPPPAKPLSKTHAGARRLFYHRYAKAWGLAGSVIAASLTIGVLGYRFIAHFSWVDAVMNAAMILTGMGPAGELHSDAAKLFASAYALFSGVVFISATGIILGPIFHHVLHTFHIEKNDAD